MKLLNKIFRCVLLPILFLLTSNCFAIQYIHLRIPLPISPSQYDLKMQASGNPSRLASMGNDVVLRFATQILGPKEIEAAFIHVHFLHNDASMGDGNLHANWGPMLLTIAHSGRLDSFDPRDQHLVQDATYDPARKVYATQIPWHHVIFEPGTQEWRIAHTKEIPSPPLQLPNISATSANVLTTEYEHHRQYILSLSAKKSDQTTLQQLREKTQYLLEHMRLAEYNPDSLYGNSRKKSQQYLTTKTQTQQMFADIEKRITVAKNKNAGSSSSSSSDGEEGAAPPDATSAPALTKTQRKRLRQRARKQEASKAAALADATPIEQPADTSSLETGSTSSDDSSIEIASASSDGSSIQSDEPSETDSSPDIVQPSAAQPTETDAAPAAEPTNHPVTDSGKRKRRNRKRKGGDPGQTAQSAEQTYPIATDPEIVRLQAELQTAQNRLAHHQQEIDRLSREIPRVKKDEEEKPLKPGQKNRRSGNLQTKLETKQQELPKLQQAVEKAYTGLQDATEAKKAYITQVKKAAQQAAAPQETPVTETDGTLSSAATNEPNESPDDEYDPVVEQFKKDLGFPYRLPPMVSLTAVEQNPATLEAAATHTATEMGIHVDKPHDTSREQRMPEITLP